MLLLKSHLKMVTLLYVTMTQFFNIVQYKNKNASVSLSCWLKKKGSKNLKEGSNHWQLEILSKIRESFILWMRAFKEAPEWVTEVAQSHPTLCDPMDCSLPGSSLHGILQARVLEWVAISFPRGSSWPRDQTWVSGIPGRHFNLWATREALKKPQRSPNSSLNNLTFLPPHMANFYEQSSLPSLFLWEHLFFNSFQYCFAPSYQLQSFLC